MSTTTSRRRSTRLLAGAQKKASQEQMGSNTESPQPSRPDTVPSAERDATPSAENHENFDSEDYKALRQRYLKPRVRKNVELGGGMCLRKQTAPAIINQNMPGYRRLKQRIASLDRSNNHVEIYRLLHQLREWEIHAGRAPRSMLLDAAAGEDDAVASDVKEVVDLTQQDPQEEAIDVDSYIIDVLLVKVKEEEKHATHPAIEHVEQGANTGAGLEAITSRAAQLVDGGASRDTSESEKCRIQQDLPTPDVARSNTVNTKEPLPKMAAVAEKNDPLISFPGSGGEVVDVDAELVLDTRKPVAKWTRVEDEQLCSAVATCADNSMDWSMIAQSFQGRTNIQCLQRWQHLNPSSTIEGNQQPVSLTTTRARAQRNGNATTTVARSNDHLQKRRMWTKEEEDKLIEAVNQNELRNWSAIASSVRGRSSQRCREHWYIYLDPTVNRSEWTSSEDNLILEMHSKIGSKWTEIATTLGKGRIAYHVQRRALYLLAAKRQKAKQPGSEMADIQDKTPFSRPRKTRKRKEPPLRRKQYMGRPKGKNKARIDPSSARMSSSTTAFQALFHLTAFGSWRCDHGHSRIRFEVCNRCANRYNWYKSGATGKGENALCCYTTPSFYRNFDDGSNRQSTIASSLSRRRSAVPEAPSQAFGMRLLDANTNHIDRRVCAIIPNVRIACKEERSFESNKDLTDAWKAQLRLRRKGDWRPTGGWTPPKWACRPSSMALDATLSSGNCLNVITAKDNLSTKEEIEGTAGHKRAATKKAKSSSFLCGKAMAIRVSALISANLVFPSIHGKDEPKVISCLGDVKYPSFQKPTDELLTKAHSVLQTLLPKGDCDSIEVVRLARRYYDHWRPEPGKTRVILLAESHAFTKADVASSTHLNPAILANYTGPREFVSLVYCLAYGENEAIEASKLEDDGVLAAFEPSNNKGTPQFWSLLAACSRGTDFTPAATGEKSTTKYKFAADILKGGGLEVNERLLSKVSILEDLRDRGIWLLDASVIGWYITQPQKFRRSKVTNEVHRIAKERPPKPLKAPSLVISWEMFTKHVVHQAAEEGGLRLLIPIGKEVEACLTRQRLEDAVASANDQSQGSTPVCVTESFPAPNAWIPGGYGPFFSELARLVFGAAPPTAAKTESVKAQ